VTNTVLATAVAATLALAAPQAFAQAKGSATKAEIQEIQAQMQALTDRLNRLETANTVLQTENEQLKVTVDRRDAEIDYLKAQTKDLREESAVAANDADKVRGADWATRIKGRGDLRYRHESIDPERVVSGDDEDAADRYRHRIRARLGFDYKVTDNVKGTLLFATGGDDPRSSNQTLGGAGTRKSIGVDLAFVDWRFMNGGDVILGKQSYPQWRPGQSLFFDGDFNPEGGAVKFERGMLFGSAYGWWLTEQYNSNPTAENTDANLFGAQLGVKFPLLGGETVLAVHYFDCGACQDNSPLYANSGNGNTTYTLAGSTTNLLRYDYQILELSGQMGTTVFGQPLSLWADYAQNMAADVEYDTAYGIGVLLGKASNAKTWEAGVAYQSLDKDALFAQIVDSDFGDGRTDSEGWFLKGGYAPVKNVTLNATYFINTLNKDVGTELDYSRLQLDLNYKF
jgi:hypothetical protein